MRTFSRLLAPALAAAILSACDTIPVLGERGGESPEPTEAPASTETTPTVEAIPLDSPALQTIEPSEHESDPEQGIETSLGNALAAEPPRRQELYLDAARKLIDIQRFEAAEAVLGQVVVSGLPPVHFARKRLQQAAIFFHRNELQPARRFVEAGLRRSDIDPAVIARGLDLKARIDMAEGQPLDAARTWVRRHELLAGSDEIAANNERIWLALGHLSSLELRLAGQPGSDPVLQGWLDLATLVLELIGDRHALRSAVAQWSEANRGHPAARFSATLLPPRRAEGIRQIALLLPLSSEYGAAARVVYNGFDAGNITDSHPARPQVVFYDIGGEASLAGNYVGVATSEGADVIVGPLGRAAVTSLLQSRQPERPMVLLGSAPNDQPPAGSYELDLSPEQEARWVAERMYATGHRRVAALHPQDDWGRRLHDAFTAHWDLLGGTLAGARPYSPGAEDHTATIRKLFNLNESEARHAALEARSGLDLEFEARRRRDIDALFLAARPGDARLIKPQVNFYQGHDLAVYSTSHVYSGSPDRVKDTDLDGITFPAMPWVLRDTRRGQALQTALQSEGIDSTGSRLFAFGYDAYQLALLVPRANPVRDSRFSGVTSTFVFDAQGRLRRDPEWGRFQDGVPVTIWRR